MDVKVWKSFIENNELVYWEGKVVNGGRFKGKRVNKESDHYETIISEFTGNMLDGTFTIYFKDEGKQVGTLTNGRVDGNLTTFDEDGNEERVDAFVNGVRIKRDGIPANKLSIKTYIDIYKTGPSSEMTLYGIEREGKFECKTSDGSILTSEYKGDVLHGDYMEINERLNYRFSGKFLNGYRQGMENCYPEYGSVLSRRYYSKGVYDGPEVHYSRHICDALRRYIMWKSGRKLMEIVFNGEGDIEKKIYFGDEVLISTEVGILNAIYGSVDILKNHEEAIRLSRESYPVKTDFIK